MGAAVGIVGAVIGGGGAGGLLGGLLGGGGIGQMLSSFLGGAGGAGGAAGIGSLLESFSPANVLNASANLVNSIMGNATKQATQQLNQQDGMPKFIMDEVNKAVDKVLKQYQGPTDPECQQKLNDGTKSDADKTIDDLVKKIVENVRKQIEDEGKDNTADARCGGKGGKKSAGSWLQKIAQALGEVLGEKAAKMVELSDKVSKAADAQKDAAGTKDEKDDKEAAAEMTKAQTELQGVSQEYKLLSETISTVVKGIGEALSTLGRKQ